MPENFSHTIVSTLSLYNDVVAFCRLHRCREVCKSWDEFIKEEIVHSSSPAVKERIRKNMAHFERVLW